MTPVSADVLRIRIQAIKDSLWTDADGQRHANKSQGASQSTLSILRIVYGDPSPQLSAFQVRLGRLTPREDQLQQYDWRLATEIPTVLDAALADFESGLAGSLRAQAKGEVLGDFVALARAALDERTEAADRVAAVLTAAALEETLKQVGEENGADVYNRDMRGVIQKLKDHNVLTGPNAAIALGFAVFRDKASHGQFDQIDRATTQSALAFTEGTLSSRLG